MVFKSVKPTLETRLEAFLADLETHQKKVEKELQAHIDESKAAVVDFYLFGAVKNPPDAIIGQSLNPKPDEEDVRKWLSAALSRVFPKAEDLTKKMILTVTFKDVTFETLNQNDFLKQIKAQFPEINWDKAYKDFLAAREKSNPGHSTESTPANR